MGLCQDKLHQDGSNGKGREAVMSERWQNGKAWLWRVVGFALLMGLTARLSDEVRSYAAIRQQRLTMDEEVRKLERQVNLLKNKLRYLKTPDGVRFAKRLQNISSSRERLLPVVDDDNLVIDVVQLLPGGLEEWEEDGHRSQQQNELLNHLFRRWLRLQGQPSR